ncbi:MAG: prolipoprotein diacylglyceryl transferase [Candidatus Cloacimonetes bacterium 4572_65]|nr:MAG: prolipoprotein diacylglyceryl transferase [Candidatus Cloacimonetes bacterium 4572_65]
MIVFPEIKPYIVKFEIFNFPLEVRYYGLLYILSFALGYFYVKKNLKYRGLEIPKQKYEDLIFAIALGVIIGGRVGYMLFYALPEFIGNPLTLFQVWNGGMSFHGGALGVLISSYIFCRKNKINYFAFGDAAMPFVAVGLGLGRLGNYLNAELYGSVTTLPWGVLFPGEKLPRHPSQLYEMLLEGVVLFLLLQFLLMKTKREGTGFWTFFLFYGVVRILIEFVRIPDDIASLYPNGLLFGALPITQGQFLSIFMVIFGAIGLFYINKKGSVK